MKKQLTLRLQKSQSVMSANSHHSGKEGKDGKDGKEQKDTRNEKAYERPPKVNKVQTSVNVLFGMDGSGERPTVKIPRPSLKQQTRNMPNVQINTTTEERLALDKLQNQTRDIANLIESKNQSLEEPKMTGVRFIAPIPKLERQQTSNYPYPLQQQAKTNLTIPAGDNRASKSVMAQSRSGSVSPNRSRGARKKQRQESTKRGDSVSKTRKNNNNTSMNSASRQIDIKDLVAQTPQRPPRLEIGPLEKIKKQVSNEFRQKSAGLRRAQTVTLSPQPVPSSNQLETFQIATEAIVKYDKHLAPAEELIDQWEVFQDQHLMSKTVPKTVLKLQSVRNFRNLTCLQLERQDITIIFQTLIPCKQLQSLHLSFNRIITRDITFVKYLTSLRKLDLSHNSINFMPESQHLKLLTKLEFLILHQNQLVGWRQLENLCCLKGLKHLTLYGNPCAKIRNYRKHMIDTLPNIYCLDEFIVMDFERSDIGALYPKDSFRGEKRKALKRFKPYNLETTAWEGYGPPAVDRMISKGVDSDESGCSFYTSPRKVFLYSYDAKLVTAHLNQEHYELRRKFEWCSPGLAITKVARSFLVRRRINRKKRMIKILYWALRRWNRRFHLRRLMQKLKLTDRDYLRKIGRVRVIQKWWKNIIHVKKQMLYVAKRMQATARMIFAQNAALPVILGLKLMTSGDEVRSQDLQVGETVLSLNSPGEEGGTIDRTADRTGTRKSVDFTIGTRGSVVNKTPKNFSKLPSQIISQEKTEKKSKKKRNTNKTKIQLEKQASIRGIPLQPSLKIEQVDSPPSKMDRVMSQIEPRIPLLGMGISSHSIKVKSYQVPRILIPRKQLLICERLGITEFFIGVEQSSEFVLKKLHSEDTQWPSLCRSPLISWMRAVYSKIQILEYKTKKLRQEFREVASNRHNEASTKNQHTEIGTTSPKQLQAKLTKQGSLRKKSFFRQDTMEGKVKLTRLKKSETLEDIPQLNIFNNKVQIKAPALATKSPHGHNKGSQRQLLAKPTQAGFSEMANYNNKKQVLISAPFAKGVSAENALVACTFDSDKSLLLVMRKLILFNRVNKNKLIVLFEPWLHRFRATIIIQRWIRGVLYRSKQMKLFYDGTLRMLPTISPGDRNVQNTMLSHLAMLTRAVIRIQRVFKNWRFRTRLNTLSCICRYVKGLDSTTLYLEETTYHALGKIERAAMKKSNTTDQSGTFMERNFKYLVDDRSFFVAASVIPSKDPSGRYSSKFLPHWFNDKTGCNLPPAESAFCQATARKRNKLWNSKRDQKTNHLPVTDLWRLIHLHAFPPNSQKQPCVVSLSQVTVDLQSRRDMRFVKIQHVSLQEAKNRAVLLALKTINQNRPQNSFVRLFTEQQLFKFQEISAQVVSFLKFYKLTRVEIEKPLDMAVERQPHNGIISKHEEPYRTIIRARPKRRGQLDRFIVLGENDPEAIKRRIEEMLSPKSKRKGNTPSIHFSPSSFAQYDSDEDIFTTHYEAMIAKHNPGFASDEEQPSGRSRRKELQITVGTDPDSKEDQSQNQKHSLSPLLSAERRLAEVAKEDGIQIKRVNRLTRNKSKNNNPFYTALAQSSSQLNVTNLNFLTTKQLLAPKEEDYAERLSRQLNLRKEAKKVRNQSSESLSKHSGGVLHTHHSIETKNSATLAEGVTLANKVTPEGESLFKKHWHQVKPTVLVPESRNLPGPQMFATGERSQQSVQPKSRDSLQSERKSQSNLNRPPNMIKPQSSNPVSNSRASSVSALAQAKRMSFKDKREPEINGGKMNFAWIQTVTEEDAQDETLKASPAKGRYLQNFVNQTAESREQFRELSADSRNNQQTATGEGGLLQDWSKLATERVDSKKQAQNAQKSMLPMATVCPTQEVTQGRQQQHMDVRVRYYQRGGNSTAPLELSLSPQQRETSAQPTKQRQLLPESEKDQKQFQGGQRKLKRASQHHPRHPRHLDWGQQPQSVQGIFNAKSPFSDIQTSQDVGNHGPSFDMEQKTSINQAKSLTLIQQINAHLKMIDSEKAMRIQKLETQPERLSLFAKGEVKPKVMKKVSDRELKQFTQRHPQIKTIDIKQMNNLKATQQKAINSFRPKMSHGPIMTIKSAKQIEQEQREGQNNKYLNQFIPNLSQEDFKLCPQDQLRFQQTQPNLWHVNGEKIYNKKDKPMSAPNIKDFKLAQYNTQPPVSLTVGLQAEFSPVNEECMSPENDDTLVLAPSLVQPSFLQPAQKGIKGSFNAPVSNSTSLLNPQSNQASLLQPVGPSVSIQQLVLSPHDKQPERPMQTQRRILENKLYHKTMSTRPRNQQQHSSDLGDLLSMSEQVFYSTTVKKMEVKERIDGTQSLRQNFYDAISAHTNNRAQESVESPPIQDPISGKYSPRVQNFQFNFQASAGTGEANTCSPDFVESVLHNVSRKKLNASSPGEEEDQRQRLSKVQIKMTHPGPVSTRTPVSGFFNSTQKPYPVGKLVESKVLRSNHFVLHDKLQQAMKQSGQQKLMMNPKYQVAHTNLGQSKNCLQPCQIAPFNQGPNFSLDKNSALRLRVLSEAQIHLMNQQDSGVRLAINQPVNLSNKKMIIDLNSQNRL